MIAGLLSPKPWVIFGAAFLIMFSGATLLLLKIRTLERDTAVSARRVAEASAEAYRRESILIRESFDRVRKADHERTKFISDNAVAVERQRRDGDRPLSPVLRDAAERVRLRYQNGIPGQ